MNHRRDPEEDKNCDFAEDLHKLQVEEMELDWDDREVA